MKINIGLYGAGGKMAAAVEQMLPLMKTKNQAVPYLSVGNQTSALFAVSAGKLENVETEILEDVDVWIDFTSHDGLEKLLKQTSNLKTPVVSGSTGLSEKQFLLLKAESKKRPLFWASNMSPGLWAFRQAMKGLSSVSHFDFVIDEIHHTQKKDNPSGTAKTLHGDLENLTGKRIQTPVGYRIGGVFGVHTLYAASSNEVITMQHQALNRTVFAEGSLLAADWLVSRKPGYYSMDDMMQGKKK